MSRQPEFDHELEYWMGYGVCPLAKSEMIFSSGCVSCRCEVRHGIVLGAPVLPVGPDAPCLPSSLHPCTSIPAATYLDWLPTLVSGMKMCVTAWLGKSLCL